MAYDEDLAARVRALLAAEPGLVAKPMFGGLGFLLGGHLCCGVQEATLIVRLAPAATAAALARPHTRPFLGRGRPMPGWVVVEPAGWGSEAALAAWVGRGRAFARSLPPK